MSENAQYALGCCLIAVWADCRCWLLLVIRPGCWSSEDVHQGQGHDGGLDSVHCNPVQAGYHIADIAYTLAIEHPDGKDSGLLRDSDCAADCCAADVGAVAVTIRRVGIAVCKVVPKQAPRIQPEFSPGLDSLKAVGDPPLLLGRTF